jgi:hypothetical protein
MFPTGYLFLPFLAALPLARTISTGRGGRSKHTLYRDLAHIAAPVLPQVAC